MVLNVKTFSHMCMRIFKTLGHLVFLHTRHSNLFLLQWTSTFIFLQIALLLIRDV